MFFMGTISRSNVLSPQEIFSPMLATENFVWKGFNMLSTPISSGRVYIYIYMPFTLSVRVGVLWSFLTSNRPRNNGKTMEDNGTTWEKPWKNPWKNHGKTMEKPMEKPLKTHGNTSLIHVTTPASSWTLYPRQSSPGGDGGMMVTPCAKAEGFFESNPFLCYEKQPL